MAAKLSGGQLLAERTPESPRMVIAISKVENLSSDLIPVGEQWMLMAKVRDSVSMVELGKQRNVVFVIPAEHLREAKEAGTLPEDFGKGRKPTHEMGTRRSARRRGRRGKTGPTPTSSNTGSPTFESGAIVLGPKPSSSNGWRPGGRTTESRDPRISFQINRGARSGRAAWPPGGCASQHLDPKLMAAADPAGYYAEPRVELQHHPTTRVIDRTSWIACA